MIVTTYLPKKAGFTLIEMLVVLVILGLTTTLLSEGLSNTWRNFERLSGRDLVATSAQLPVNWFVQSIDGAVLYHPYHPVVKGNNTSFEFISIHVPHDNKHIPQKIIWMIEFDNNNWLLMYSSEFTHQPVTIKSFSNASYFEYLVEGNWQQNFTPTDARLPQAVRIKAGEQVYVVAKPGRPTTADVPPELPLFGQYEF